jgi:hypothetical protein
MNGDLKNTPGAGPRPISGATPVTSPDDATATIARWLKMFEDTDHPVGEAEARQAIAALNPLMEKLTGLNRSNAVYVEMLAYGRMDSDVLFCRAYAEVIGSDGNAVHLKTATYLQQGRNCK